MPSSPTYVEERLAYEIQSCRPPVVGAHHSLRVHGNAPKLYRPDFCRYLSIFERLGKPARYCELHWRKQSELRRVLRVAVASAAYLRTDCAVPSELKVDFVKPNNGPTFVLIVTLWSNGALTVCHLPSCMLTQLCNSPACHQVTACERLSQ